MAKTLIEFTFDFVRVFSIELVYAGPILVFLISCICLMGYIIGRIEGWSNFDALYHALINATTVGYGDFRPTKKRSKMLAVAIAFVGIVLAGIVVAIGIHASEQAFEKVYDTKEFVSRKTGYSPAGRIIQGFILNSFTQGQRKVIKY